MDEQDPAQRQRPVSSHPNAVSSVASDSNESQSIPPPRAPLPPQYQKEKNGSGRKILIVFVVLIVIAALAYWFLVKPKPAKAPTASSSAKNSSQNSKQSNSDVDTDHHESPSFNLGFDYPKGWKVSDISGSDKVVVTSPALKLKDAKGQQVDGQVIMTIRGKTQKLTEFDKGAATAVINSEKIAYTKPSETQRGNTYISFLNYSGSKDTGLDSIYITGDAGYQKDQEIPAVDISKIDPITNVTFVKCSDSKCSSAGTALTVATSSWQDSNFSKPIKTLLQSLSIQ
jgi:hypothetical protein